MKDSSKPDLKNPIHLLAFGFGSGLAPFAPGTMGTLLAVPIYFYLLPKDLFSYLMVCVVTFIVGIWICDKTSSDLGVHDHSGIVWDEFVGYFVTMIAMPVSLFWAMLGFGLFRLFDIWKPWPINWLDKKVTGGLGIMVDDLLAGIYAAVTLQLIVYTGIFSGYA